MKLFDKALFYYNKTVFGIMELMSEAYQDPTIEENWLSIDFKPIKTFEKPMTLEQIKQNKILSNTAIIKQPRLLVVKLREDEFMQIEMMERTK